MELNSKRQLLDQLVASRAAITRDVVHLRTEWNFKQKAITEVRLNPLKWLGRAALSGFLLAKLRGRRRAPAPQKIEKSANGKKVSPTPEAKKFGLLAGVIGLIRLLSPVLRPLVMSYVSKSLTKYASHS